MDTDLQTKVDRMCADIQALRRQLAYIPYRFTDVDRSLVATMPVVCLGTQMVDHHKYRQLGFHPVVKVHDAHIVDPDRDGLFAAYDLWPGAPLQLLWDRMNARGFTEQQKQQFLFIRDHPTYYGRCVPSRNDGGVCDTRDAITGASG